MYLPKTKYKNKVSTGLQVKTPNGLPYRGNFIELYDGRVYQGKDIENLGSELVNPKLNLNRFNILELLKGSVIIPTPQDYINQFFIRYFLQSTLPKKTVEVSQEVFVKAQNFSQLQVTSFKWRLVGYREDTVKNGVVFKGLSTYNSEEILKIVNEFPKIKVILSNLTQFGKFIEL
jgi:hypothetical protein